MVLYKFKTRKGEKRKTAIFDRFCDFYGVYYLNGNMSKENMGTNCILGSNLEFLLGEQSKNIFGNKGDFGNFSRELGSTDPSWGALIISAFRFVWNRINQQYYKSQLYCTNTWPRMAREKAK